MNKGNQPLLADEIHIVATMSSGYLVRSYKEEWVGEMTLFSYVMEYPWKWTFIF